jgi:predicted ATPase
MTPSQEEIQEILASLDAYYAATPLEFSIGLQNFQSIRHYTKIHLAPITLIYGQNSAGKSAIHDALIFIHEFLGDRSIQTLEFQSTTEICAQYLNRWASHQRTSRLLSKGYIGQPDDVIISINAWDKFEAVLGLWDKYKGAGHLLHDMLLEGVFARFNLRFHFSKNKDDKWYTREFHLVMGNDEFIRFDGNENSIGGNDCFFCINRKHLLFSVIGKLYGQALDEMAKECEFFNGETIIEEDWLILKDLWFVGNNLEWSYEYGSRSTPSKYEDYLEFDFNQAEAFRHLIEGLLRFVSDSASLFAKVDTVQPLRPVPKTNESYRFSGNSSYDRNLTPWKNLAKEIRVGEYCYLWDRLQPNQSTLKTLGDDEPMSGLLGYVNHVLQHPFFLNTGYEIIGECRFLLSATKIAEIQNNIDNNFSYFNQELDSEVTLKLRYVPDNFTIEIEDVGVGISQIIPVLCAINDANPAAYIHQPELHLHPKQQSHLGDIFIERINNNYFDESSKRHDKYFFIETHSEHILLRILRRIRETNRSDIRNKLFGFTAEQLCVLYVDKDENGDSQVFQLRVAENGEFIDRWPHGFFTERDEDLFDE